MLFNIVVMIVLISSIIYAQTYKKGKKAVRPQRKACTRSLKLDIQDVRRDFRGRFIEKTFISWAAIRKENSLNY